MHLSRRFILKVFSIDRAWFLKQAGLNYEHDEEIEACHKDCYAEALYMRRPIWRWFIFERNPIVRLGL